MAHKVGGAPWQESETHLVATFPILIINMKLFQRTICNSLQLFIHCIYYNYNRYINDIYCSIIILI